MQQKISPKKYIETQAKKLPIYKCLINKDWEENRMANVVVMRRHVNDNVTLGFYLVDLLCLGIKDTFYKFNIPEFEAEEMLESQMGFFGEFDYNLAHNIVYAGHDFAMEFDIPPHKDFSLTKNILEEDDDNIPLIDIAVGDDEDGKPHLIINAQGQGKWALEKLKKNAGAGNYYYTDEGDSETGKDFEENRSLLIDDCEKGMISAIVAKDISTEELMDLDKVSSRQDFEILNLSIECMVRVFETDENYNVIPEDEFIETPEFILTDSCDTDEINSADTKIYIEDLDTEGYIQDDIEKMLKIDSKPEIEKSIKKLITKHSLNFYGLTELYKFATVHAEELEEARKKICSELNNFTEIYPLAKLYLAFESVYNNMPDLRFANVQYSNDIQSCFPAYKSFGSLELQLYWLIKTLKSIKEDNVEKTIFYYQLAVEAIDENEFLIQAQVRLIEYFNSKVN